MLCLIEITGRSLGFDEAATVTIAAQHGSALGTAIAHDGGNMSGYYLLEHVLIGAFGNGAFAVRFPSVIASVATVALVGAIGLRLFGYRAAFAAGLLSAVSLPLVFWAQSARGYALMVAFVTGAFLVLISLAEPRPALVSAERGRRCAGRWIAFVVLMALATYSSFVAVLVIPAQLLVLLPRRRRSLLRPFLISFAAVRGAVPAAVRARRPPRLGSAVLGSRDRRTRSRCRCSSRSPRPASSPAFTGPRRRRR